MPTRRLTGRLVPHGRTFGWILHVHGVGWTTCGRGGMTPEQVAAASKPAVLTLGEAYTRCPTTLRRARLLGISGWAFYVTGRAGALGDVRAETVAAALGFIAPDAVADGWDAAARASLAECCRWGEEVLGDLPRVDRLAVLVERAVARPTRARCPCSPPGGPCLRTRRRPAAGGGAGRPGGASGALRLAATVPAGRTAGAAAAVGRGDDRPARRSGVHGARSGRRCGTGRAADPGADPRTAVRTGPSRDDLPETRGRRPAPSPPVADWSGGRRATPTRCRWAGTAGR